MGGAAAASMLKEKQPVACRSEGKEAGRVDQWLRVLAVLAEDQSIPSTHGGS